MSDNKKDGLIKKIGKTAVKTGTSTAKGAVLGAVTGVAADIAKEGIKQVSDASGLTKKSEDTKSSLEKTLKGKENEIKKKLVKEAIKKSLK